MGLEVGTRVGCNVGLNVGLTVGDLDIVLSYTHIIIVDELHGFVP